MGISGLLPLLKPIQVRRHLDDFRGQTLAIDAYVWLHRGTYNCATDLAQGRPTTRHVDYVMHKVRLLRHHGIKPYFVFDGGPLPAKRGTEVERRQRREECKRKGDALAKQGRHKEAREFYCKAVDVTPEMAYQVIKALKAEGVDYVVAPYEADAQLAHLERAGLVDGIITEDSDLLVFGCKRVLYKFDPASLSLVSVSRSDFGAVPGIAGWTDGQFRAMAILSGCDYLPSVNGVGLKTALKLLRKHRTLDGAIRGLRLDGKYSIPREYAEAAKRAELVFLHQRVFDPVQQRLVHLAPRDDGMKHMSESARVAVTVRCRPCSHVWQGLGY
ncbi:PIN domain-like protein [Vararia minispora EC-137]|uniref:PIN domain-like protein n=1 Tax=Vararia minispora EC-137 TaxID=1314806 RepID=A0ACB8QM25_9AGAM|nr:PIN domain-like protein [Vararia minispora EC-137]